MEFWVYKKKFQDNTQINKQKWVFLGDLLLYAQNNGFGRKIRIKMGVIRMIKVYIPTRCPSVITDLH
jgi:hypothetical protein